MRNVRALATGLAAISCVCVLPLFWAGVDRRVLVVTAGASVAFAGCAAMARSGRWGPWAAATLNGLLMVVLLAGVAVNRQIGPGPAFVGFSLFVAAATLPMRGVIASGAAGALAVAAMGYVARDVPQLAVPPRAAVAYGLTLCLVTTMLSIVQVVNVRRALAQVVERERRALAAEAEHRAMASQLQQAQKMDALGRMAAAVAHDFNNMLTVIRSAITLAEWELPPESPALDPLRDAEKVAIDAGALTQRLLAFSRKAVVEVQVIDARSALGGLKELLPRALGPDVDLDVKLEDDLPPVVAAPVQLEQIVLNLAINARDAMPSGGKLTIAARARTDAKPPPRTWLELEVSDTGTGMDDGVMAHLFEPFFTTKPPGKGTGLGLSTCYGIVNQLGGSIRASSVVGRGTTFTILLPRAS
jgi:signal transduction histidine kinase